jgi:hypothetical protein
MAVVEQTGHTRRSGTGIGNGFGNERGVSGCPRWHQLDDRSDLTSSNATA